MSRRKHLTHGPFRKVVRRYYSNTWYWWVEVLECGHERSHYGERDPKRPPMKATKRKCYGCTWVRPKKVKPLNK